MQICWVWKMLLSDLQHCKQIEFNVCFIQIINSTSIILVQTITSPIITDYDKNNLISKLSRKTMRNIHLLSSQNWREKAIWLGFIYLVYISSNIHSAWITNYPIYWKWDVIYGCLKAMITLTHFYFEHPICIQLKQAYFTIPYLALILWLQFKLKFWLENNWNAGLI